MMYILTAVDLLLAALFAILNSKVWRGFAYFVLALLLVLALAWGIYLIVKYFTTYKKELQADYEDFKLQKRGVDGVSAEEIEEHETTYRKEFGRTKIKQKLIKWFIIVFCFALAASFLFAMFFYR